MNNSSFTFNGSKDDPQNEVLTPESELSTVVTVVKLLMCALVALVALLGNIIVIIVVFKTKRMHTNTYFLIVNLSISDLLYTVISIPPFMTGNLGHTLSIGGTWGTVICKFTNGTAFGLMASSVLTLAAISCDRFFSIVCPLKRTNTKGDLRRVVISIWVSSALVMLPMLYSMRMSEEDDFFYCYEDWSPYFDTDDASKAYTVALFVIIYMVPFTSMLIFYALISHFLWFRKIPGSSSESTKRRVMANRCQVIRMLITIVLCFIICWLPLQIVTFSYYFGDAELPEGFFFASDFLIKANGAINPMIYAVFNEKFRRGFKSFLFCMYSPLKADKNVARKTLSLTPTSKYSTKYLHGKRKETFV